MIIHTIDTRHGTANDATFSHGNCLPYTGLPWGMNYFAPSTANNRGAWWFHPNDRTFEGYRITHQPSPWMGDFSHLTMTPISGLVKDLSLYHITSSYRPEEAIFNPTRLKITQCRYQITSELIPSMYGGLLDITYKDTQASENGLVLHLPGQYKVAQEDSNLLSLSVINFADCEDKNFTFYCILKTSQPFTISEQKTTEENGAVQLHFGDSQQISIHFATSFISQEQAQLNLKREQDWSKEDYLTKAEAAWRIYFHVFRLNTITKMKFLLSTITSIVLSCFLKHFMNTIRIIGKFIMILLLKALKQDHFTPIMDFGILSELSIHYTA